MKNKQPKLAPHVDAMNAMVREIQPNILFNGRNGLPGDFATPEQHLSAPSPWCMPTRTVAVPLRYAKKIRPQRMPAVTMMSQAIRI